ncbi:hypothetical protein PZT57_30425 [Pseudomonas aeruginosa]|uniref:hypothetical protein n=1 Tax=Pseudomonas aeruginosa TaxID=287 RepID=UPI002B271292|nr:hypothetical protein [Pseudomonas aeruginosa]MEA8592964.1 hypothetical protein [Pseudomonas aeruginosa]
MIKLVEFLSRSMCVILFSALLSVSWLYQDEIGFFLGLSESPMLNRLAQLLLVAAIALSVGAFLNWLLGRLLWRLERRRAIKLSPPTH